jgi:hypothetical protein
LSHGSPKKSVYVCIEGEHVCGLTKISLLAPRIHKLDPSCIKLESHVNPCTASIISPKA